MNFREATPIQQQAIPPILEGKDILGIAQTGTGKTAAFVLPVLHRIMEHGHHNYTQALVIVPTRELALQIDQAVQGYAYFTGTNSIAIYGGGDGADFTREQQAIAKGVDIIIATPGKLITHLNAGSVKFNQLRFLILDEADRMLDMGFQPDLLRIISVLNEERQTLMFSATMPEAIARMARSFMKDPVRVSIARAKPAAGVKQGAYVVSEDQKLPLMVHILKDEQRAGQIAVVFCSRKHGVAALYRQLKTARLNVASISSDLLQAERETVLQKFRSRQVEVLVATDVISRGIDIDDIDLVVNYDVPRDEDDYVHRIGRTARAAKKGEAITLVTPAEQKSFARIEAHIDMVVEKLPVPAEFGPAPDYLGAAQPGGHGSRRPGKKPFRKKPGGGRSRVEKR